MSQPQRNRDDNCDVIFRIGNRSFMACREVLIQRVKYFESMFTLDMKEKNDFIIHLDSEVFNPNVFDGILNFIYSSKINISVDNVKPLYRAADFLCFTELSDKIVEYMNSDMILENIPTFMIIAKLYKLTTLEENCRKCILAHPNNLGSKGNGMVHYLTYEELTSLLGNENLGTETKFNYVVKWILVDETDSRQDKLMDLLRIVDFEKLSPRFLKEIVARNVLILDNMDALQFVLHSTIKNVHILNKALQLSKRGEEEYKKIAKEYEQKIINYRSTIEKREQRPRNSYLAPL